VTETLPLLGALGAGLLGSGHCLGMCGGIVGAFAMGVPPERRQRALDLLPFMAGYNFGRIATYALLGALAGLAGGVLGAALPPAAARSGSRLLAAFFLVGLGLYLAGLPQLLQPLERLGARFWRRLEPLGRRLLRPATPWHTLALGAVWGWLPCGLVYSMLALAAVSGGPAAGAATMAAFGVGTLPALAAAGFASSWLARLGRSPLLYLAVGLWLAAATIAGARHADPGQAPPCPLHAAPAAPAR
jgi:sulfite exporter TauE/SafE